MKGRTRRSLEALGKTLLRSDELTMMVIGASNSLRVRVGMGSEGHDLEGNSGSSSSRTPMIPPRSQTWNRCWRCRYLLHTLYLVDKIAAERLRKLFNRVMRRERRYRF